jgi:hypothetical protein
MRSDREVKTTTIELARALADKGKSKRTKARRDDAAARARRVAMQTGGRFTPPRNLRR